MDCQHGSAKIVALGFTQRSHIVLKECIITRGVFQLELVGFYHRSHPAQNPCSFDLSVTQIGFQDVHLEDIYRLAIKQVSLAP